MGRRLLQLIGVAAVVVPVAVLLRLATVPVAGQTSSASAQSGAGAQSDPAPTTPWGEPDLQGIWTNDYQIPLQRPAQYAGKEFFTDEERANLDRQRAGIPGRDRRSPRGTEQDVGGAYNAVFLTTKHTGRRTSLIVDPPNGRIPPLTPEAQERRHAIREFQLALLQATDTCKNNLLNCSGGQYGPPSPRRAETPPHYLTAAVNRADGPEDRSLGERCMSGRLPDFGGATRASLPTTAGPAGAGGLLPAKGDVSTKPGQLQIFGIGRPWCRTLPRTSDGCRRPWS